MPDLDPSTPFKSQAEMIAARGERDSLNRSRFDFDAAHREAWEAKCALGYSAGEGPSLSASVPNEIRISGQQADNVFKIVALQQEKSHLEGIVDDIEIRKLAASRDDPTVTDLPRPTPFKSKAELLSWSTRSEYRNNVAVRRFVEQRIALTNMGAIIAEG